MSTLSLQADNYHEVRVSGRRVLFHIPTTALYELDEVTGAVLDLFREHPQVGAEDVRRRFDGAFPAERVVEALCDLRDLQIVADPARHAEATPLPAPERFPLSTLVLNVNTGCNLSCTYCYKEDLATPARGRKMDLATAERSIDLLLREGAEHDRVTVVFFGGEPLSNLPMIRGAVDYAERRAAAAGKRVDFSITTNGTLLDEATIDYLDAHGFSVAVSMDGPRALHDKRRLTVGGRGTYDTVARKVRMLLDRYRARPVGARVTLTSGVTDVVAIHQHLREELGFHEVGFAPVTSGAVTQFNLGTDELAEVFAGFRALGERYLAAALGGGNTGFSNMHQLMTDLWRGTRKALPCGAGVGMLAVDKDGELNLCHRFTGSSLPTFGNVTDGIARERLGSFIAQAADRSGRGCATCHIRNLCAGGCYHESYARYGDPLKPTYHYCDLMRDWIDFGIDVYTRLLAGNPGFFERHIEPRRRSH